MAAVVIADMPLEKTQAASASSRTEMRSSSTSRFGLLNRE